MLVVSNTSPLTNLAAIDRFGLLESLFGEVHIAEGVWRPHPRHDRKLSDPGKVMEKSLENAGITTNKNTIPYDPNPPLVASGIRLGTAAVTTRGMKEGEMEVIADLISEVLADPENEAVQASVKERVEGLTERFPLYR